MVRDPKRLRHSAFREGPGRAHRPWGDHYRTAHQSSCDPPLHQRRLAGGRAVSPAQCRVYIVFICSDRGNARNNLHRWNQQLLGLCDTLPSRRLSFWETGTSDRPALTPHAPRRIPQQCHCTKQPIEGGHVAVIAFFIISGVLLQLVLVFRRKRSILSAAHSRAHLRQRPIKASSMGLAVCLKTGHRGIPFPRITLKLGICASEGGEAIKTNVATIRCKTVWPRSLLIALVLRGLV
jgi:hypothetical protein